MEAIQDRTKGVQDCTVCGKIYVKGGAHPQDQIRLVFVSCVFVFAFDQVPFCTASHLFSVDKISFCNCICICIFVYLYCICMFRVDGVYLFSGGQICQ